MYHLGQLVHAIRFDRASRNGLQLAIAFGVMHSLGCTPIHGVSQRVDSAVRDGGAGSGDAGSSSGPIPGEPDAGAVAADGGTSDAGAAGSDGARRNPKEEGKPAGGRGPQSESGGLGEQGGMAAGPTGGGGAGAAAGSGGSAGGSVEEPPLTDPLDLNQTAFASETADAEALSLLADWSELPVLATGQYQQQSSHDRGQNSLTEATVWPVTAHGNRDLDNFICKSADADTGSAPTIGFQFDAAKCPEPYVHGVMLARFQGSGRMTRFWLTADALSSDGGTLTEEVLRIYVDDNPRAVVQVPLEQVRTGAAGEIFTTPFGATSKSYIAWYYPIAFNSKLVVVLDRLRSEYWYQVDAALDAQPRHRVVPRQRLSQRDAAHALLAGASPVPAAAASLHVEQLALAAGEQRALSLSGPAMVEELRLRVPKDKLATLAGVRISARWDGAAQPAVDVPLLDLFAASHAVVAKNNLALAASVDGTTQSLSLRLPMPFQTSADWTLKNGSNARVDFQLEWIGEKRVPSSPFGHLSVQDNNPSLPTTQLEQTVAEATGRGRYVGVCADLGGHVDSAIGPLATSLDLLQGDFRATADGMRALDGTGTEDYADNALYFKDAPQATPFASSWARTDDSSLRPPGQVSFCRWQVLGGEIDFQQSLKVIREASQSDTSIVERHHTLAFLYLP
jgi:hypothetical protein